MNFGKTNKMLGIALGESEMLIAEVRCEGAARRCVKRSRFAFPDGVTLDKPAQLGAALAGFLKAGGFAARAAVIGLPGRSVLCAAKAVPPAAPEMMAGILQLQAEREFSGDAKDWVFDYVPRVDPSGAVLLAAASRHVIDQLMQMAEAAGVELAAITASPMALATAGTAAGSVESPRLILDLDPHGASIALRSAGQLCLFQHLAAEMKPLADAAHRAAWTAGVAGEIRRIFVMHGVGTKLPAPTAAVAWDVAQIGADAVRGIGEKIGIKLDATPGTAEIGLADAASGDRAELTTYISAAALAVVGLSDAPAVIDFAHSRLAPPPRARFGKWHVWAASIAALVLIAVGALVWDWQDERSAVADLESRIKLMGDTVKVAHEFVDRVHAARGWYDTRPPALDCIRAISLAFPTDTPMWTTALVIRDNMAGSLTGKTASEKAVLELMDRLKASKRFEDVKLVYMRQADRKSREVSFAFNFVYLEGK